MFSLSLHPSPFGTAVWTRSSWPSLSARAVPQLPVFPGERWVPEMAFPIEGEKLHLCQLCSDPGAGMFQLHSLGCVQPLVFSYSSQDRPLPFFAFNTFPWIFFFLAFNARRNKYRAQFPHMEGKMPAFLASASPDKEFGDFHLLHTGLFPLGGKPLVGLDILAVVSNPNDAGTRRHGAGTPDAEQPQGRLAPEGHRAPTPGSAPGSAAGIPQRRPRSGADVARTPPSALHAAIRGAAAGMDPAPAAARRHLLAARSPRPPRGRSSRGSASCPPHSRPRPARSAPHGALHGAHPAPAPQRRPHFLGEPWPRGAAVRRPAERGCPAGAPRSGNYRLPPPLPVGPAGGGGPGEPSCPRCCPFVGCGEARLLFPGARRAAGPFGAPRAGVGAAGAAPHEGVGVRSRAAFPGDPYPGSCGGDGQCG